MRTIDDEFPTYPTDSLPSIPRDWRPSHYRNDVAPSWVVGSVWVLIDYPDTTARELPLPRFRAYPMDSDGCPIMYDGVPVCETENWDALLAYVAQYRDLPTDTGCADL